MQPEPQKSENQDITQRSFRIQKTGINRFNCIRCFQREILQVTVLQRDQIWLLKIFARALSRITDNHSSRGRSFKWRQPKTFKITKR